MPNSLGKRLVLNCTLVAIKALILSSPLPITHYLLPTLATASFFFQQTLIVASLPLTINH